MAALALLAASGMGLSACGDTRKALGLEKNPPDEFKIVNRAPLSLPPDYALRPPQPGAARPQEQATPDLARQAVMGAAGRGPSPAAAATTVSPGETALLARAGARQADPRIRETVDREALALADADKTFLDYITFWRKPEDPGTVVDAEKEAQRLRENAALGRPATDGDTPIIRKRKKGALEGIF